MAKIDCDYCEMRHRLDHRIHMQRRSLHQLHGFLEMRGNHRPMAKDVRSSMVKSWSQALQEAKAAKDDQARIARIFAMLGVFAGFCFCWVSASLLLG